PWLVFSGDSLLIGDVGRPDLHVAGDARGQARSLHGSLQRLLELPDYVVVYPSHYGGSGCGPGLSRHPVPSLGLEPHHNPPHPAIAHRDALADDVLTDAPPPPPNQAAIVAANRSGRTPATA